MKAKLLKRLRATGRNSIDILSVTTQSRFGEKTITGMSYSYPSSEYRGLFNIGNSEEQVREKACKIYLQTNIEAIRKKYRRHSKLYSLKK